MSVSIILTILGILVTIALGWWGIQISLRLRYPGRITFFKEYCIGLFDSIARNLPELKVLYKNEPVGKSLVLLKGVIINSGTKDITDDMIEDKLKINLPKDFKWIEGKVISASHNVKANIAIPNETELVVNTGLFRCEENIRFEALAEVPLDKNSGEGESLVAEKLETALNFSHRIADTREVEISDLEKLTPIQDTKLKKYSFLIVGLFMILTPIIGNILFPNSDVRTPSLHYILKENDKNSQEITFKPIAIDTLELKGIGNDYYSKVTSDSFFKKMNWEPKFIEKKESIIAKSIDYIYIILGIVVFIFGLYRILDERRKRQKFDKIFNIDIKEIV